MKSTKTITLIAMLSAILTVAKLSLMWLGNVELVSILILTYACKLRIREVFAITALFCVTEILMFGFNTWIISYLIYWNILGVFAHFACKLKHDRLTMSAFIAVMTAFFGLLTTLVDTGLFTGFYSNFFYRFSILYVSGIYFFLVHIISNMVIVFALYPYTKKTFCKLHARFFNISKINNNHYKLIINVRI